jgi:hypothetical protein
MSKHETYGVAFFEDFFDYNDYDENDITTYVTENYIEDLHLLGKILMKGVDSQDFYKDIISFFREGLNGLIEYAEKHNIQLP